MEQKQFYNFLVVQLFVEVKHFKCEIRKNNKTLEWVRAVSRDAARVSNLKAFGLKLNPNLVACQLFDIKMNKITVNVQNYITIS